MVPINLHPQTLPFRGRFTPVSDLNNHPSSILQRAGLDWTARKVPLYSNFSDGDVDVEIPYGQFAISRPNGNGHVHIDGGRPVSGGFQLPNNVDILTDMCQFATDTGLIVDHVGMIDNGRMIVAEATDPNPKILAGKVGDEILTGVVMMASYQSGVTSSWQGRLRRLVCTNGMMVDAGMGGTYKLPHRGAKYDPDQVRMVFGGVQTAQAKMLGKLAHLGVMESPKLVQRAYLMELTQGDLFDLVMQETSKKTGDWYHRKYEHKSNIRGYFLDALTSQDVVEGFLNDSIQKLGTRTLKTLIDLSENTQPGLDFVRGTVAQPYHAITHWVDHYRGHGSNQDSAVEQSLFGVGATLKVEALKVAGEYGDWVRNNWRKLKCLSLF